MLNGIMGMQSAKSMLCKTISQMTKFSDKFQEVEENLYIKRDLKVKSTNLNV